MAYRFVAHIGMTHIVMAYIVLTYIVGPKILDTIRFSR